MVDSQHKSLLALICFALLVSDLAAYAEKPKNANAIQKLESISETNLANAERRFEEGNIKDAQKILKKLEPDLDQFSRALKVRVMLLIVRVSYAFQRNKDGEKWLSLIWSEDSDVSLDPVVFPPEALEYWKELSKKKSPKDIADAQAAVQSDAPDPVREEARFWIGLFPLGIGHIDAGQYELGFFYGGLGLSAIYSSPFFRGKENFSPPFTKDSNQGAIPDLLAATIFTGMWGFELNDMAPILLARDHVKANNVRALLSFAPLGVAQKKNGHTIKAFGIGLTQGTLLTYALATRSKIQKTTSLTALGLVYLYGVYDGWVNHRDVKAGMLQVDKRQIFSVYPSIVRVQNTENPALNLAIRF